MNKIFFRCSVLALIACIVTCYSPAYGRVRSGEEGSKVGAETCKAIPNRLDGSNEKIISPPSKQKVTPLFESLENDSLVSEQSLMDTKHDLFIVTGAPELKNNNVSYFKQIGIASWYGKEFDGKITASGELCNTGDMVASHNTLPFGTLVEVVNNLTGQSITVRINDRGPVINGRVINLSCAAAEKIDLIEKGIVEVTIRTVASDN